jgi:hypothetical protein
MICWCAREGRFGAQSLPFNPHHPPCCLPFQNSHLLKQIALLSSSPSIKSRLTALPPSFPVVAEYRRGKDPPSWDPASSVGQQAGCALEVCSLLAGPLPTSREARRVVGDKSASLTSLPSAWVPRNSTSPDAASASSFLSRLVQDSSTRKAREGRSSPLKNIWEMITGKLEKAPQCTAVSGRTLFYLLVLTTPSSTREEYLR